MQRGKGMWWVGWMGFMKPQTEWEKETFCLLLSFSETRTTWFTFPSKPKFFDSLFWITSNGIHFAVVVLSRFGVDRRNLRSTMSVPRNSGKCYGKPSASSRVTTNNCWWQNRIRLWGRSGYSKFLSVGNSVSEWRDMERASPTMRSVQQQILTFQFIHFLLIVDLKSDWEKWDVQYHLPINWESRQPERSCSNPPSSRWEISRTKNANDAITEIQINTCAGTLVLFD